MNDTQNDSTTQKAYVVTGPTSGIGHAAAIELAMHGIVVLVGRDPRKLEGVKASIERAGQKATSVTCNLSDLRSVERAAREVLALRLPIAGVLNNAGIMATKPTPKSAQGFDATFATNHLGPFAFTEALATHLRDGTRVLFVASAIEDPERKPAKAMGIRGGRYISAEASARGEWQPGGSRMHGMDAYATSKQALLAATLALARETPRLRINAVEPGITRGTALGGAPAVVGFLFGQIMRFVPPFSHYASTPERAARVITRILVESEETGVYYDERGRPMRGSVLAHDPAFQDRVVSETRALLSRVPGGVGSAPA